MDSSNIESIFQNWNTNGDIELEVNYDWEGDVLLDPIRQYIVLGSSGKLTSTIEFAKDGVDKTRKVSTKKDVMRCLKDGFIPYRLFFNEYGKKDYSASPSLLMLANKVWKLYIQSSEFKNEIRYITLKRHAKSHSIPRAIEIVSRKIDLLPIDQSKRIRDVLLDRIMNERKSNIKIASVYQYFEFFGLSDRLLHIILHHFGDDPFEIYGIASHIGFHIEELADIILQNGSQYLIEKYLKEFIFLDDLEEKIKNNENIDDFLDDKLCYYRESVYKICSRYTTESSQKVMKFLEDENEIMF